MSLDKKQDVVSIELTGDDTALEKARLFLLEQATEHGLPASKTFHLELALEELLVNVVNYAYKETPGELFTVTCCSDADFLVVSIIDVGPAFNPLTKEAPDLDKSIEEREIGGLGIFLTREMVDEFAYKRHDGKNISTFKLMLCDT